MRNLTKKSKAIIAVAAIIGLAGSGAAYSYWSVTGSGSSSATTGTVIPITVNMTAAASPYPGGTQTLSGTFTNLNSGPVRVVSVTAALGTLPAGCVAADFTIAGSAPVGVDVASGTAVGSWTGLTLTMNNTGSPQDTCKGKVIPLTLTSN